MRQLRIFDDLTLNSGCRDCRHAPTIPIRRKYFLVHTRMKTRAQFPGTGSLLPPHGYYRLSVSITGAFRC